MMRSGGWRALFRRAVAICVTILVTNSTLGTVGFAVTLTITPEAFVEWTVVLDVLRTFTSPAGGFNRSCYNTTLTRKRSVRAGITEVAGGRVSNEVDTDGFRVTFDINIDPWLRHEGWWDGCAGKRNSPFSSIRSHSRCRIKWSVESIKFYFEQTVYCVFSEGSWELDLQCGERWCSVMNNAYVFGQPCC